MVQDETPEIDQHKSLQLGATVKLDAYRIIDDTIERAIRYGYSRAFKHTDSPTKDHVIDEIHRSVMNDLCDILKFDDDR